MGLPCQSVVVRRGCNLSHGAPTYRLGSVTTEPGAGLIDPERRRAARHHLFWRFVNPLTRPFAGLAPWWVLLETTGHLTGERRRTPLARGPVEGDLVWLSSVHGRRAGWVRNIEATPAVRIKLSGRWYEGRATVHE